MEVALVMFKESGEVKRFPIGSGRTRIGRQEDCELRIPLGEVSRVHANLIVGKDAVTLRDNGSANGSYVNNKRVSEQQLKAGDHVVIGSVVFTVQIDGEPSELKPVKTKLEARRTATAAASGADDFIDDVLNVDDEDDPIAELEQLTGTGDTAAIDLDDSFFFEDDD